MRTAKAAVTSPIKQAAKYLLDPVLFARHVLKDDPWRLQEEIMRSVAWRLRTAVRSCHSSGKTYTLAQILLWWLVRWPDAIAVTTAQTDRQVEKLLWGEIHKAIARCPYRLFPDANLTGLRIGPGNYAIGFATDVPHGHNLGASFWVSGILPSQNRQSAPICSPRYRHCSAGSALCELGCQSWRMRSVRGAGDAPMHDRFHR